jgi:methyl-accepting chemotaxis protein
VLHLIHLNEKVFEGGNDHTACNAGRWFPNFKTDNKAFQKLISDFSQPHQRFHAAVGKIKTLVAEGNVTAAQKLYAEEMISAMKDVFGAFEEMRIVAQESHELMEKAQTQALGPVTEKQRAAIGLLDRLVQINRDAAAREIEKSSTQASFIKGFSLSAMIVGVVLALFLGIVITRGITKPIHRIIDALASGADQVSSASGQVSAASQSLAEGASEQAAAIEETSSSLEEMSSMTRLNAEHANQANKLMANAKSVVDRAGQSMTHMNQSMSEIASSGKEIGKIIKTIDEIAFQTNLLALNAAVEAARAGEAGAGFAVVADEVRNLAQRAAEAAKNTAGLIEGAIARINEGSELVRTTGEAFEEVAVTSNKVAELISEIAGASSEQAQGIDQVNQAVAQMDKVTQTNAANAEESASASEELNAQAESMLDVVGDLLALVAGALAAQRKKDDRSTRAHTPRRRPALPAPQSRKNQGKTAAGGGAASNRALIPMEDDF